MKRQVKKALSALDVQIARRPGGFIAARLPDAAPPLDREVLNGALRNMKHLGLNPSVVIDVGAAYGTGALYGNFPKAHHLLIEPLEEFRPKLEEIAGRLGSAEVVIGLVGPEEGTGTLHVHPDLVGSSTLLEGEDSGVNGEPREVPMHTIDGLLSGRSGDCLLKIDTQGAELLVLAGAEKVLDRCAAVVLEVSFIRFFDGGPIAHEVVAYMAERGFVVYDVVDAQHRPLDHALSQVDMIFVPESSPLLDETAYASREQREEQDRRLSKANRRAGA